MSTRIGLFSCNLEIERLNGCSYIRSPWTLCIRFQDKTGGLCCDGRSDLSRKLYTILGRIIVCKYIYNQGERSFDYPFFMGGRFE